MNDFGIRLYNQMNSEEPRRLSNGEDNPNMFFSPFSLYVSLSLLFAGSESETKEEIQSILYLDPEEEKIDIHDEIQYITKEVVRSNKSTIYHSYLRTKAFKMDEHFKNIAETYYSSFYNTKNMSGYMYYTLSSNLSHPHCSKNELFEANITREKYEKKDGTFQNIFGISESFLNPFDHDLTKPSQFALLGEDILFGSYGVNMMESMGNYMVGTHKIHETKFYSLRVPMDSTMDMMLFLPGWNTVGSMMALENSIMLEDNFVDYVYNTQRVEESVIVKIPKFTIQQEKSMTESLSSLGIRELFEKNPDLSKINRNFNVGEYEMSSFVHENFFNLTERGLSSKGVFVVKKEYDEEDSDSAMGEKDNHRWFRNYFYCHRPFMFMLIKKIPKDDTTERVIIGMGKILKPTESEKEELESIASYMLSFSIFFTILSIIGPVFCVCMCCLLCFCCYCCCLLCLHKKKRRKRHVATGFQYDSMEEDLEEVIHVKEEVIETDDILTRDEVDINFTIDQAKKV